VMPEIDGFEFLKRFRRTEAGRGTPVIVWTSKELSQREREQLEATVEAIVLKTRGASALIEELRAHVPLPGRSVGLASRAAG
jgi:CheY-like chemotaxis protein